MAEAGRMPVESVVAATLWIVAGSLGVIDSLALVYFRGFRIAVWAAALGMVNLAFAIAGVAMFRRKLEDTLGFAIGGICIGGIGVALGMSRPAYLVATVRISGLFLGGLLALVGRGRYKEWVETDSSEVPPTG